MYGFWWYVTIKRTSIAEYALANTFGAIHLNLSGMHTQVWSVFEPFTEKQIEFHA